jgi:hypothetical protein
MWLLVDYKMASFQATPAFADTAAILEKQNETMRSILERNKHRGRSFILFSLAVVEKLSCLLHSPVRMDGIPMNFLNRLRRNSIGPS